jgi:dolichol-phosphate mannosyltransferase
MSRKVVVVVPTYNERANLPILVRALLALPVPELRVLVVDDNSPDGTGEVADQLTLDAPGRVGVLHRSAKAGLGRAYVAGMTRALAEGADVVVQMDADLSHPVEAIPTMIETLYARDAAVVIGSRYVAGGSAAGEWSWRRKALSVWANFYVNAILRLHVKDVTAGFKAWRSETLEQIDVAGMQSDGYAFQVEMNFRTIKRGLTIVEVPIRFEERSLGASKMTLGVQVESALLPWRLLRAQARGSRSAQRYAGQGQGGRAFDQGPEDIPGHAAEPAGGVQPQPEG